MKPLYKKGERYLNDSKVSIGYLKKNDGMEMCVSVYWVNNQYTNKVTQRKILQKHPSLIIKCGVILKSPKNFLKRETRIRNF